MPQKYLLITLEYPPQVGGVGRYLEELVQGRGDSTRVLLLGEKDFFKFFWPKWIKCVSRVLRELRSFKPDYIEISHALPIGYVVFLTKIFKSIPYIVYVHGLDVNRVIKGKSFLKQIFLKIVLKNSYKIICNSEFTKGLLKYFNIKDEKSEVRYPKIKELSEGEKVRILSEARQKRMELGLEDKKVLVSVGRLIRRKGFDAVIKCLPQLGNQYYYIVAGDGPMRTELASLALQQGVVDRVIFVGRVRSVYVYMAIADVFIMPCRELEDGDVEGFGIVFLEANMFDKPVIGGNSGGVPEAIKMVKKGAVVDPQGTDEIVSAVKRFI